MNAVLRYRPVCFLFLCLFAPFAVSAQQVSCSIQKPPTDPAFQALTREDYAKALDLYTARAKSDPRDMEAIAGEVRSLLGSQQVDAAATLAEKNFSAQPKSAVLATALGEVRFRQGRLDDAVKMYSASLRLDPCLARTHYAIFHLMHVESMYGSAYTQLQTAHELEPDDPAIRLAWIKMLPLTQRADQLAGYLATTANQSGTRQQSLEKYESQLRAILASKKNGGCHLASGSPTTTKLPFEFLEKDESNRYHSVGFDVKINNKARARLELDTGASGILIDRGIAKKVGLTPIVNNSISGIGDQKSMTGFWAYADDLRIGDLEFQNCIVEVSNNRSIIGIDGLIGADVFENYHVQLDFPLSRMALSPLPPRPGEATDHGASLNASGIGTAAVASAATRGAEAPPTIRYFNRYVSPEMKSWSPFARVGHQILVNGRLKDNQQRLFLLDSGSSWSFLSIPAAKSVGKLHSDYEDQVTGLSGQVAKLYTVDHVDLYFGELRGPFPSMAVMSLDGLSKSNGTEVSGIIGLDTMVFLTMDIDYRDGLIHFTYDPRRGTNRLR